VVDVEATCWEGNPPPGQQAEIIEVGYALLNVPAREVWESGSLLVRPQRSRVSAFCTGLTTLTPEMVGGGVTFDAACRFLTETLDSRTRTWASYGDYDRKQFVRQCASFGVPYPFGEEHLNVKSLFARAHGLPREVGMAAALTLLKWPLAGTHHRGGDDAHNIAVILADLLAPAPANMRGGAGRGRQAQRTA